MKIIFYVFGVFFSLVYPEYFSPHDDSVIQFLDAEYISGLFVLLFKSCVLIIFFLMKFTHEEISVTSAILKISPGYFRALNFIFLYFHVILRKIIIEMKMCLFVGRWRCNWSYDFSYFLIFVCPLELCKIFDIFYMKKLKLKIVK